MRTPGKTLRGPPETHCGVPKKVARGPADARTQCVSAVPCSVFLRIRATYFQDSLEVFPLVLEACFRHPRDLFKGSLQHVLKARSEGP